jgi:Methyltransferase domain
MKNTDSGYLQALFESGNLRLMHKWMHYFEIYERHFSQFQGNNPLVLEFGVLHGGSLQMWKQYFGEGCRIHGADVNPRCQILAEQDVQIHIVDQDSRQSLRDLADSLPLLDLVIDDGGHTMDQQKNTFEEFWPRLKPGGIYLCEDTHTSYWPPFGGGYKNPNSFIEYTKNLIDSLTAWYTQQPEFTVNDITQSAYAIHFYNSVVVIEKRHIPIPNSRMKGTPTFPLTEGEQKVFDKG